MEQILNKLSEIELTAQHIMEDCNQTKQQLSAEAEKNCQDYDQQLEAQTTAQIRQIRQLFEKGIAEQIEKRPGGAPVFPFVTQAQLIQRSVTVSLKLLQQCPVFFGQKFPAGIRAESIRCEPELQRLLRFYSTCHKGPPPFPFASFSKIILPLIFVKAIRKAAGSQQKFSPR